MQKADTRSVLALINLSTSYQQYSPYLELVYAQTGFNPAEKLHYSEGVFWQRLHKRSFNVYRQLPI